jgi:hypothetical protein
MSIISKNQTAQAKILLNQGHLNIEFEEDPSFTRSEAVLIDLMQCSIGVIFENAYRHIGDLPKNVISKDIERLTRARLRGHGEGGREILLHAPVRIKN